MGRKPKEADAAQKPSAALTGKANLARFALWVVGDTPLIVHAWSEKARREMLAKQVKAVQAAKEARSPQEDFLHSLYEMGDGNYGFPVTGLKNAMLAGAHVDKGIAKTVARAALWFDADMVRVRPAMAGAICDMPLVRIYSDPPEMREDMVRVGKGLNKTASLAYRGQFTIWAIRVTGRVNLDIVPAETMTFLINEAGFACGIGEWRNEKNGMFGAFHCADDIETKAWDAYAAGRGKLPKPRMQEAA